MTKEVERRITIALELIEGKMCGWWCDENQSDERRPVTINGEVSDIDWSKSHWDTIFKNIQIDKTRHICRVLLLSDTVLREDELPSLCNPFEWTIEAIASSIPDERKHQVTKWFLNGDAVTGYKDFFPVLEYTEKRVWYIYTAPQIEAPQSSGGCPPLSEVIQRVDMGRR